jgi:glycosyltransferase involved in cell wall biosynthesis
VKTRIVHIINSFEFGGAEAMLCNLVLRTDRTRFDPHVVSLIDDLTVAKPILDAGIPLTTMGMKPGIPDPRRVWRLGRHLRRLRPALVQTWMDHSNLIGGVAARMALVPKVVWGIHHSNHVAGLTKRSTLMTVRACALASKRIPTKIVCCSEHARTLYTENGFRADKFTVIPNGFDTDRFRPDPAARASVREEINVPAGAPLVGLAARFDPLKDHATFIRAAATLHASRADVHFVLCGHNVDANNAELTALIASLGIGHRCHLLGPRHDVQRINAALDVAVSSSISEAFPLAIGEAMACGTPCVATHVGDSALIIGQTGRVVPASDPAALAAAWADVLALDAASRRRLAHGARARICDLFALDAVTRRYESLYEHLVLGTPSLHVHKDSDTPLSSDPELATSEKVCA